MLVFKYVARTFYIRIHKFVLLNQNLIGLYYGTVIRKTSFELVKAQTKIYQHQ